MHMNTKAVGLSLLLAAVALCGVDALAADAPADVAAMQAVDQSWLKAYNSGDADAIAGLYDEQAILQPPGAPAAHGRAAIRAFLARRRRVVFVEDAARGLDDDRVARCTAAWREGGVEFATVEAVTRSLV